MRKNWIDGDFGYESRKKDCGAASVSPTYADNLIDALSTVLENEFATTLSESTVNQSNIQQAINYLLENKLWSSYGLRAWTNKSFLESLSGNSKELLIEEIVEYVQKFGVKSGNFNEIKNKIKNAELTIIDSFFDDQSKGEKTVDYFCYPEDSIGFFAVREWEIVNDNGVSEYTVRLHSSNKAGMPIVNLYIVDLGWKNGVNGFCDAQEPGDFCIRNVHAKE